MPRSTVKSDLKRVLNFEKPSLPLNLPLSLEERYAKTYGVTYRDFTENIDTAEKVWNWALETYDVDWAAIFIDDYFEYSYFGLELTNEERIAKAAKAHITPSWDFVNNLTQPDFNAGRMVMRQELVRRLRKNWSDNILISASVAGPWTGMTLLYGINEGLMLPYDDEELLYKTLEFTTELASRAGEALVKAGADFIWLGDCCASGSFISVDTLNDVVKPYTQTVIDRIHKAGGLVIYHSGDNHVSHIKETTKFGADFVNVGYPCDMLEAYESAEGRCVMMGNIDTIADIMDPASPDEVYRKTRAYAEKMRGKLGYILGPGEGITENTSEENLLAYYKALREG